MKYVNLHMFWITYLPNKYLLESSKNFSVSFNTLATNMVVNDDIMT